MIEETLLDQAPPFSQDSVSQGAARVIESDSSDVAAELIHDDVGAVVWNRPNPCAGPFYPPYAEPARDEWGSLCEWLEQDLALLADWFGQAASAKGVAIRLETATERTCPRFHQDNVRLRLLTAYRGPGVEWRCGSGLGSIASARTGAVVLMKGRIWATRGARLLHRSPKASSYRPRWVLAIDAATNKGPGSHHGT